MVTKMAKKVYLSAFLLMVVLSASVFFVLDDKVRIDVQKTRTKYSVWENNEWTLAATEYVRLWDGSTKMLAKSRSLANWTIGKYTYEQRTSVWKENITTIQTYIFDNSTSDVEQFPAYNIFECINCVGKIVSFEINDITYTGPTTEITSPFSFGHNMKVEWQNGAYYAKVFQQKVASDKVIIKYRPTSDYQVYKVRLFDPDNKPPEIVRINDSGCLNFTSDGEQICGYFAELSYTLLTEFSDASSAGNLSYTSAGSLDKSITLPYNAEIYSFTLDLDSFTNFEEDHTEDAYTEGDSPCAANGSLANAFDGNYATSWSQFLPSGCADDRFVYVNYTTLGYQDSANLTISIITCNTSEGATCNEPTSLILAAYNYSSDAFVTFDTVNGSDYPGLLVTYFNYTTPLLPEFISNDTFQLKFIGDYTGDTSYFSLIEMNIDWYSFPVNITIDVGNDTEIDYQNDTLWNGSHAIDSDIDINVTVVRDWLYANCPSGTCNVPIIFNSSSAGKIEYSDIKLNYSTEATTSSPYLNTSTFNDSSSSGYMDTVYLNVTKYISMNNLTSGTINESRITLTSNKVKTFIHYIEDGYEQNTSECAWGDTFSKIFDVRLSYNVNWSYEDLSTYWQNYVIPGFAACEGDRVAFINYTNNDTNQTYRTANFTVRLDTCPSEYSLCETNPNLYRFYSWNYSGSTWSQIGFVNGSEAESNTSQYYNGIDYTFVVPSDSLMISPLKIKMVADWLGTKVVWTIYGTRVDWYSSPVNLSIDTGNDGNIDYRNDTLWNTSSSVTEEIDLNSTAFNYWLVNNCTSQTCLVPITFRADTQGNFSYSDIFISSNYTGGASGYTLCGPTGDGSPTVGFTTDEACNCSISTSPGNYSDMNLSCTGNETTIHNCTLSSGLVRDSSTYTLYMSCCDSTGLCANGTDFDEYIFNITVTQPPDFNISNLQKTDNRTYCDTIYVNITWTDADNVSTVFFVENSTGSWTNHSTTSLGNDIYQFTTTSQLIGFGDLLWFYFIANDTLNVWNQSMSVQSLNTTGVKNLTITIYEDGLAQARKYELNTTATINVSSDACNDNVLDLCLDIDSPHFGGNYSCSNSSSFLVSYNQQQIYLDNTTQGHKALNTTFSELGEDILNFTVLNYTVDLFKFKLQGFEYPYDPLGSELLELNSSLVSYWDFENNSNDSVGGNHLTVHWATPSTTHKLGSYSYYFDGNDWLDNTTMDISDDGTWTLAFWFQDTALVNYDRRWFTTTTDASFNENSTAIMEKDTATRRCVIYSGLNESYIDDCWVRDAWMYVILNANGTHQNVYINNILKLSVELGTLDPEAGFNIGGHGVLDYSIGYFDDVALFNISLSNIQMDILYNLSSGNVNPFSDISTYPEDVTFDLLNNGVDDIVYPGMLNGTNVQINEFSDGSETGNITIFYSEPSFKYINMSSNYFDNTVYDLNFQVSGYQLDPENMSFTEYLWDNSSIYNSSFTSIPYGPMYVYDDFSTPEVSGRWVKSETEYWETPAEVVQGQYFRLKDATEGFGHDTIHFASGSVYNVDVDLSLRRQILLKYYLDSDSRCSSESSGDYSRAKSTVQIGIRDGRGYITPIETLSTSCIGNRNRVDKETLTSQKTINLKFKDDGFIYINDSKFASWDRGYRNYSIYLYGYTWGKRDTGEGTSEARIYFMNMSGMTGNYIGNLTYNESNQIDSVLLHSFTNNITRARITPYILNPTGGTVSLWLSADNGSNWETAANGTDHYFSNAGNLLKARVNVSVSNTDVPVIVDYYTVEVVPGFTENITIDLGYDGSIEWSYNGILNETTSPQNVTIGEGNISLYIGKFCEGALTCNIPLAFQSPIGGVVEYKNIDTGYETNYTVFNETIINEFITSNCTDFDCDFNVSLSTAKAGTIEINSIDIAMNADTTINITAHVSSTANYSADDTSQLIYWRYSPFDYSMPYGVEYYDLFPGTLNAKNVEPYGQYIGINESRSTPIFNFTTTAKVDPVDLTVCLNTTFDNCLNVEWANYANKTDSFTLNTSSNCVTYQNFSLDLWHNSTAKVYNWWNLTSCNSSAVSYLDYWLIFDSWCGDGGDGLDRCVRVD